MVVILSLLALGMIATGGAAMVFGAQIIQVERGWTMVIAGSVGASGGAVLLGIALTAQRLGRIVRETVRLRDRMAHLVELSDERAEAAEQRAVGPPPAPAPTRMSGSLQPATVVNLNSPPPPPQPQLEPRPDITVVGQYASGGNSYTMYSDGSIRADTPDGPRRFGSLEELRASMSGGGEQT